MPYMKLSCPDVSSIKRQEIAATLTNAVVQLNATRSVSANDLRERCTVHFTPYAPDGLAIGGRLMRDRPEPDVTMEYSDWSISMRRRRRLAAALTPLLAQFFGLSNQLDHVNIRFHPYRPSDFAVGGTLLSDLIPRIGQWAKRMSG
jgi:phenylpyruvate tautomerase PptA (4-oxalocrotonate tautomerase family)